MKANANQKINEKISKYLLVSDIVFKYKNESMLFILLKEEPLLANIYDQQGNVLFEKMIDSFLLNAKLGNNTFNMSLMLSHFTKHNVDKRILERSANKLYDGLYSFQKDIKYTNKQKQQFINQIKELVAIAPDLNINKFKNTLSSYGKSKLANDHYGLVKTKNNNLNGVVINNKHVNIYTIDDLNCSLMEDAISIEKIGDNYKVTTYISDVDSFLGIDVFSDELMYKALNESEHKIRGLFSNSEQAKMLHNVTLKEKEVRRVIAYEFLFDQYLNQLSFDVKKMNIIVEENLRNENINELLRKGKNRKSIELSTLLMIAHNLHFKDEMDHKILRYKLPKNKVEEIYNFAKSKPEKYLEMVNRINVFYNKNNNFNQIISTFSKKYGEKTVREIYTLISNNSKTYIDGLISLGTTMINIDNVVNNTPGQLITQEFSLLTNKAAASYMNKYNLPFIYRVDDYNERNEILNLMEKSLDDISDIRSQTLSFSTSGFSAMNKGLKVSKNNPYGSVTNPARDYDALVNQHLFKKMYIDNKLCDYETKLKYEHTITYIAEFMNEMKNINRKRN